MITKRLLLLLILVSASCDIIRAQQRSHGDFVDEIVHGSEDDYFFGEPLRRSDDEDSEDSVATPQDPDGDGVIGTAGKDYPVLRRPPKDTSFTCQDKTPGIYADMETGCQVYHICQADKRRESSLCVNGTVFNQESLACDWWYNVDCSASPRFYWLNDEVGKQTVPNRGPEEFQGPSKPSFHPITSFIIDFPPPIKKPSSPTLPSPPLIKKAPIPPPPFQLFKKPSKDKSRPSDVNQYGRDSFNPALNVPPKPKNFDKKFNKQALKSAEKSPLTIPVKSDDVISGYSDLYVDKPVDED